MIENHFKKRREIRNYLSIMEREKEWEIEYNIENILEKWME